MNINKIIYKNLKRIALIAGYDLIVSKRSNNKAGYELVIPMATYSPWLSDQAFNDTFEIIKNHTLVDKYRCYELWQLIGESAKLDGAFIEIGVWRGGSGTLIAKKVKLTGINSTIYLCDTFKGVVKAGDKDTRYKGGEHADTSKKTVEELIQRLNLDNIKILVGIFPDEISNLEIDSKFRFCHIDVDVYQSAKDIVDWLWPKLVIGGMIVFDDYGFQGCDGITRFVNEGRKEKDKLVIHNINGHAIFVKLSD